jgi:dienelactone hydrolase
LALSRLNEENVMKRISLALLAAFLIFCAAPVQAAIQSKEVDYQFKGVKLHGFLAWDDASTGKRPGILVVHEWWGLNDYARKRAKQLAGLGYVAFAADMYGDGKTTEHPDEAGSMMHAVQADVDVWMGRAAAALDILKSDTHVDPNRLAAIGYCFGGATALQMAYRGMPIKAAVSFHGALTPPASTDKIKASILILQGDKDPFVSKDAIEKVRAELKKGHVSHKIVIYAGAEHAFTVPGAEDRGVKGLKYDAKADAASWQEMMSLFATIFGKH